MNRSTVAMVACALLATGCASGGEETRAPPTTAGRPSTSTSTSTITTTTTSAPTLGSAGCASGAPIEHGISEHTLQSGGVDRVYALDVPASYDGTEPYAVLFGLHALTVSYQVMPAMAGFDMGDEYQFIGVAPSGLLDDGSPFWMAAPTADNYDVAFIARLLDELESTHCIDPSRVFATGMSNGAQMSSLLACRLADRIAAVAPVAGEEFLEPCDGRPARILAFHGTEDSILPYEGGGLNATAIANAEYWKGDIPDGMPEPLGIDDSMRRWARHNRCDADFAEQRISPHVVRRTWPHCEAATVLYVLEGGGHAWPAGPVAGFDSSFGDTTAEINATALMFKFFFEKS